MAGEIHVPGGVDEVYDIWLPLVFVIQAYIRGLDGHLPELLDFNIIQGEGFAGDFGGYHASGHQQVV